MYMLYKYQDTVRLRDETGTFSKVEVEIDGKDKSLFH